MNIKDAINSPDKILYFNNFNVIIKSCYEKVITFINLNLYIEQLMLTVIDIKVWIDCFLNIYMLPEFFAPINVHKTVP